MKTISHTVGMIKNANYMPANIFRVFCVGLGNYIFIRDTAYDVDLEWRETVF